MIWLVLRCKSAKKAIRQSVGVGGLIAVDSSARPRLG